MSAPPARRPEPRLQASMVASLRGGLPAGSFPREAIDAAFRRYECGGWLHALWRAREPGGLPDAWRDAAAQAHRKTLIDTLAALGTFREIASHLGAIGAPFILIKGAAYLAELHPDPGTRALTDIDLVVRPADAPRLARRLASEGFHGIAGPDYPEDCRFEMLREGPAACRVEIHWRLGSEGRMRFDEDEVWSKARPLALEGERVLVLGHEDAVLYHAGHAAGHYFGPTLKWVLDLRAMFRRWRPDPAGLAERARSAGLRTALHLALRQWEAILPGEAPPGLIDATDPGPLRRAAIGRARSSEPAEFLRLGPGDRSRFGLRPFLFDTFGDAAVVAARVALRPAARWRRRARGDAMPWEARGSAD